jgi:hypothetical protein
MRLHDTTAISGSGRKTVRTYANTFRFATVNFDVGEEAGVVGV